MLLTITNTKSPATDLGYLLHKNPRRMQSFELPFGKAHVFDPVGLVRTRRGPSGEGGMLDQYVKQFNGFASSQ